MRVVPSQIVDFIDATMHGAAGGGQQVVPANLASTLVSLLRDMPNELLVIQHSEFPTYLSAIKEIEMRLETRGSDVNIVAKPSRSFGGVTPIAVIRRMLAECPDEFPAVGTTELAFIPDAELQRDLRLDLSAAGSALRNGEWKAATVMAGSVVEALLLWALAHCKSDPVATAKTLVGTTLTREPSNHIERWDLNEYIETAHALRIIEDDTASQSRLAKDFRNLIHPGRSARLGLRCDRATALAALAAVEFVIRDLTSNL